MKKDTYVDTGTPGIKQNVITKKYVVSLDFGRQLRMNKKTGRMEMKQIKTTRTVSTMKEAKAIQGKNNALKKTRRTTGITRKIAFDQVLDEYTEYYKSTWSDSYMMQKQSQAKRMKAYFSDRDVRTIDTLDIEKFFAWCKESQPGFEYPLSNNSIQKIRTHLKDFWRYMKKNQNRYGITENVVLDADYGEVQVFKGNILNAEQVNYMLQFAINYEADYSVWSMIGFTVLTGMRRGELCGIKWRNIDFENRLIDVEYQRCQISTGSIEKVPKKGNDDGHTREERKQRYAALPDILVQMLEHIKAQQEEYLQRSVKPDDYIYMTKENLVRGYLPRPGKVSRRFSEFLNRVNKARGKDGLEPLPYIGIETLVADAGYKTPAIAKLLIDAGIKPLLPYKRPMTKDGFFKKYEYVYDEYYDCYICPNNQVLTYRTTNRDGNESRAYVCVYELEKVSKDKGKMGIAGDEKTAQKYNFGCNSFDKRNMALGFISQSRFVYSLTWPAVVKPCYYSVSVSSSGAVALKEHTMFCAIGTKSLSSSGAPRVTL